MVVEVKKPITRKRIDEALKKASSRPKKGFQASKHYGKLDWPEDAVALQKRLRDEWD